MPPGDARRLPQLRQARLHGTGHAHDRRRALEPMDVPVPHRHLEMTHSLPAQRQAADGSVTSWERAEQSLHMMGIVFGHDVIKDTTVSTSLANRNSPLVWDNTMLDAVKVYAASNQAMLFSPFVLAQHRQHGGSGGLCRGRGTRRGGLHAARPSRFAVGVRPVTATVAELAPRSPHRDRPHQHARRPAQASTGFRGRSGGCSSSKLADAQAGYEAARNMYGVLMAGANFVLSTTGYLESALRQSYAKVALDGEQMRMMYRLGKG